MKVRYWLLETRPIFKKNLFLVADKYSHLSHCDIAALSILQSVLRNMEKRNFNSTDIRRPIITIAFAQTIDGSM